MRILILSLLLSILSCSTSQPEQELIKAYSKKDVYGGLQNISLLELGAKIETYLIGEGYLKAATQKEYFDLITEILENKLEIDEQKIERKLPKSWVLASPKATALILHYPKIIIDNNPQIDNDHPIYNLAQISNRIVENGDLGDIQLIEQLIYSIPESEFEKLHYRMVPIAIIRGIIAMSSTKTQ